MKKTILLLAICTASFLNGCKKSEVKDAATTEVAAPQYAVTAQNTLNVESVKGLPNQEQKRVAYGLLKPIEKYLLWLDNIRSVSADYNPQQKLLAVELIAFLSPQVFSADKATPALNAFRDQWLSKAEKVFTKEQIRALAYQIYSTTDQNPQLAINREYSGGGGPGGTLPNCHCAGGATLTCGGSSFCPTDKVNGDCQNPTTWGCGFAWASPCDNICVTPNY